ncbi:sulfur reduction protein DsrE [Candidatus Micrarchaeota archaeon CG10_big_fil_rev_8_21_14_0_10_59_7]|nr:MAG: sulfur reduction protein DsrE [Candidatus Micrarchaeota archaeon CG10_big_fil_rev_8_21_14_0_10_59_7]
MGIVIGTNEPETVWNAFRFGNVALKAGHETRVFLLGKGVEIEEIRDDKFDVKAQVDSLLGGGGRILACGACMKSRHKEGNAVCPISTMSDLLKLVEESDKILTLG